MLPSLTPGSAVVSSTWDGSSSRSTGHQDPASRSHPAPRRPPPPPPGAPPRPFKDTWQGQQLAARPPQPADSARQASRERSLQPLPPVEPRDGVAPRRQGSAAGAAARIAQLEEDGAARASGALRKALRRAELDEADARRGLGETQSWVRGSAQRQWAFELQLRWWALRDRTLEDERGGREHIQASEQSANSRLCAKYWPLELAVDERWARQAVCRDEDWGRREVAAGCYLSRMELACVSIQRGIRGCLARRRVRREGPGLRLLRLQRVLVLRAREAVLDEAADGIAELLLAEPPARIFAGAAAARRSTAHRERSARGALMQGQVAPSRARVLLIQGERQARAALAEEARAELGGLLEAAEPARRDAVRRLWRVIVEEMRRCEAWEGHLAAQGRGRVNAAARRAQGWWAACRSGAVGRSATLAHIRSDLANLPKKPPVTPDERAAKALRRIRELRDEYEDECVTLVEHTTLEEQRKLLDAEATLRATLERDQSWRWASAMRSGAFLQAEVHFFQRRDLFSAEADRREGLEDAAEEAADTLAVLLVGGRVEASERDFRRRTADLESHGRAGLHGAEERGRAQAAARRLQRSTRGLLARRQRAVLDDQRTFIVEVRRKAEIRAAAALHRRLLLEDAEGAQRGTVQRSWVIAWHRWGPQHQEARRRAEQATAARLLAAALGRAEAEERAGRQGLRGAEGGERADIAGLLRALLADLLVQCLADEVTARAALGGEQEREQAELAALHEAGPPVDPACAEAAAAKIGAWWGGLQRGAEGRAGTRAWVRARQQELWGGQRQQERSRRREEREQQRARARAEEAAREAALEHAARGLEKLQAEEPLAREEAAEAERKERQQSLARWLAAEARAALDVAVEEDAQWPERAMAALDEAEEAERAAGAAEAACAAAELFAAERTEHAAVWCALRDALEEGEAAARSGVAAEAAAEGAVFNDSHEGGWRGAVLDLCATRIQLLWRRFWAAKRVARLRAHRAARASLERKERRERGGYEQAAAFRAGRLGELEREQRAAFLARRALAARQEADFVEEFVAPLELLLRHAIVKEMLAGWVAAVRQHAEGMRGRGAELAAARRHHELWTEEQEGRGAAVGEEAAERERLHSEYRGPCLAASAVRCQAAARGWLARRRLPMVRQRKAAADYDSADAAEEAARSVEERAEGEERLRIASFCRRRETEALAAAALAALREAQRAEWEREYAPVVREHLRSQSAERTAVEAAEAPLRRGLQQSERPAAAGLWALCSFGTHALVGAEEEDAAEEIREQLGQLGARVAAELDEQLMREHFLLGRCGRERAALWDLLEERIRPLLREGLLEQLAALRAEARTELRWMRRRDSEVQAAPQQQQQQQQPEERPSTAASSTGSGPPAPGGAATAQQMYGDWWDGRRFVEQTGLGTHPKAAAAARLSPLWQGAPERLRVAVFAPEYSDEADVSVVVTLSSVELYKNEEPVHAVPTDWPVDDAGVRCTYDLDRRLVVVTTAVRLPISGAPPWTEAEQVKLQEVQARRQAVEDARWHAVAAREEGEAREEVERMWLLGLAPAERQLAAIRLDAAELLGRLDLWEAQREGRRELDAERSRAAGCGTPPRSPPLTPTARRARALQDAAETRRGWADRRRRRADAVTHIARVWRGREGRRAAAAARRLVRLGASAPVVQGRWRIWVARRERAVLAAAREVAVSETEQWELLNYYALRLQSVWRMARVRDDEYFESLFGAEMS
eukprot:TRINITY_DN1798_c0_g3_i1.p1 TRINITY_DN1798_c0_g3~~TRINITY_DN1798_c0_g3_i1.p1  ORF type:complete len:1761 (+),score=707.48 TRINITY_DN1798_c0_g3_i1:88-5283(+)